MGQQHILTLIMELFLSLPVTNGSQSDNRTRLISSWGTFSAQTSMNLLSVCWQDFADPYKNDYFHKAQCTQRPWFLDTLELTFWRNVYVRETLPSSPSYVFTLGGLKNVFHLLGSCRAFFVFFLYVTFPWPLFRMFPGSVITSHLSLGDLHNRSAFIQKKELNNTSKVSISVLQSN